MFVDGDLSVCAGVKMSYHAIPFVLFHPDKYTQ